MTGNLTALDHAARAVRHIIATHPEAPIYVDLGDHSLSTASAADAHRRVHILPVCGQILVYAAERGGFDRRWLIGRIHTIPTGADVEQGIGQAVAEVLAYITPTTATR